MMDDNLGFVRQVFKPSLAPLQSLRVLNFFKSYILLGTRSSKTTLPIPRLLRIPPHIMTSSSAQRIRPQITGVLIDVSGTLHVGSTPTPGAVNAFCKLQEKGIPFRLCSNMSKESTVSLVRLLDSLGFKGLESTEKVHYKSDSESTVRTSRLVWTSIGAVSRVSQELGLKRPFLLLCDSAREEALAGSLIVSSNYDSQGVQHHYDSVIVGLAPDLFDYQNLNTAFRILKGEPPGSASTKVLPPTGVPLIATHKAKYIQTADGLSLGPGPFVAALENASGVTARVVGKPTKDFFQMVINDFTDDELRSRDGFTTAETGNPISRQPRKGQGKIVVIGDDVEADLGGGALELDLWRVLVKTGKYRAGDENRPGAVSPDEVFETFADFVESLMTGT